MYQAIRWAIKKRVHIISMSWTIEKTNKNARQIEDLDAAIKEAHKGRILMFGAASDQGFNSSNKPYPAKGTGVICIGAAKGSGHAEEVAEKDSDYLFPGGTLGIKLPRQQPTEDERPQTVSGSSFATALATGLTSLILYCVDISKYGKEGHRESLQDYATMKLVFETMARVGGHPKYIGVERFFKATFADFEWELDGKKELDDAVEYIIR
jgi:hypothetical protein